MSIHNKTHCPICGTQLKERIICNYRQNAIIVECDTCGEYAMSMEFYEDHVEQSSKDTNRAKLAIFLENHKTDKLRPFFSQNWISVVDGFKNYPYQICILGTNLDK